MSGALRVTGVASVAGLLRGRLRSSFASVARALAAPAVALAYAGASLLISPPDAVGPSRPPTVAAEDVQAARPGPAQMAQRRVVGEHTLDLRLLVIAADGRETALAAIRQALDYSGTPYRVWVASDRPGDLAAALADGPHGHYQGVILTSATLAYSADGGASFRSALGEREWRALAAYEAAFGVRRASWSAYPSRDLGLLEPRSVDSATSPFEVGLTEAGRHVFPYLDPAGRLPIRNARAYLARPADAATTPLLLDDAGDALAVVHTYPDGREQLALTFESNQHLLHAQALAQGVVGWVTRGLFLGQRRVYLSAQVDDLFLANRLWDGGTYRLTGDDLRAVLDWQRTAQARPFARDLRLDLAFNGYGLDNGPRPDSLAEAAAAAESEFKWINHTYSHRLMDGMPYATAREEIERNRRVARAARLTRYDPASLVTPEVSGLAEPPVLQAAAELGVRYLVSDASREGYGNPSPNAGLHSTLQPALLLIPRRPTSLFYDVSTPEQWVAEFNDRYRDALGRELDYDAILERESDVLLSYLLKGDLDPLMFHQANLRAYDGRHSLLTDLLDRVLDKYDRLLVLPILSPTMDELGERVGARMQYAAADASATLGPGDVLTVRAGAPARVPITGLCLDDAERYGGDCSSYLDVTPDRPVTVALPP